MAVREGLETREDIISDVVVCMGDVGVGARGYLVPQRQYPNIIFRTH